MTRQSVQGPSCDGTGRIPRCSRDKDGLTPDDLDGQKVFFCAVSSRACDEEQTWIVPQEVEIAAGSVCYLCPTQAPESIGPPAPESIGPPAPESNLIAAIVVYGGWGAFVALYILYLVYLRSKMRDAKTRRRALVEEQSGLPTRTIHIAEGHNENNHLVDSENGQNLTDNMDMDNAAVLSDEEILKITGTGLNR